MAYIGCHNHSRIAIIILRQKGEIPDVDHPSDIFPMSSLTSPKTYSPSRVEAMRTADIEQNRLSDIVSAPSLYRIYQARSEQWSGQDVVHYSGCG